MNIVISANDCLIDHCMNFREFAANHIKNILRPITNFMFQAGFANSAKGAEDAVPLHADWKF